MSLPIHVKFPDASGITSEVETDGYDGQVAAFSISFSVHRAVSVGVTAAGRETSLPTFSEASIVTTFDSASNDLLKAATLAKPMDVVEISFLKDTGDGLMAYLVYKLKDVLITSYALSSGGEVPTVSISMAYNQIESLYKKQASDHAAASDHEFNYDLRKKVA